MIASPQSEVARDIKEFVKTILDSYTKVKTINEEAGKRIANPLKKLPTKKPEAQKPAKKKPAAKK